MVSINTWTVHNIPHNSAEEWQMPTGFFAHAVLQTLPSQREECTRQHISTESAPNERRGSHTFH